MRTILLALVLAGCTTSDPEIVDDGWGETCEVGNWVPGHSWTACESQLGETGICIAPSVGEPSCRRFCIGGEGNPDACPVGQTVHATVEGLCYCEP